MMNESSQKFLPKWLLDVGNGEIGEPDEEDNQDSSWITIPTEYCVTVDNAGMSELIDFIYDADTLKIPTARGQSRTYLSNDKVIPMVGETSKTEMLYPMEYLNTITFLGFSPHELQLKVGSPIMLLRKVNLLGGSQGKCRGPLLHPLKSDKKLHSRSKSISEMDLQKYSGHERASLLLHSNRKESISDVTPFGDANTGQKYRRKVDIENLDGNIVEFTMWDEVAK
ncbi:DNA helicase [Tanacetum coccineum]